MPCGWFGSTHVLICLSASKAEQITVELTLETPDLLLYLDANAGEI